MRQVIKATIIGWQGYWRWIRGERITDCGKIAISMGGLQYTESKKKSVYSRSCRVTTISTTVTISEGHFFLSGEIWHSDSNVRHGIFISCLLHDGSLIPYLPCARTAMLTSKRKISISLARFSSTLMIFKQYPRIQTKRLTSLDKNDDWGCSRMWYSCSMHAVFVTRSQ